MLTSYIKLALKVLARRKFFTFISLFGITLTLAVLVVAAAILDNVFEPRAPESRFDRALILDSIRLSGPENTITGNPGYGFLDRYARNLPGAEATSFFTTPQGMPMYVGGRKIDTYLRRTDGAYWRILDFDFVEGGPFTEAENRDARQVAVITEQLRSRVFGGGAAVGKPLTIDGQTFRVVGVVRDVGILRTVGFSEIWAPVRTMKGREYETQHHGQFGAVVLARSRADFPRLRAGFQQRIDRFVSPDPRMFDRATAGLDTPFEAVARGLFGAGYDPGKAAMLKGILVVAALLFVTLPTMNLVSINLSRIMERAPEIGVRKAFGASGRSLVGQFVTENIVLTLIGGLFAFVLAWGALSLIENGGLLPHANLELNLRIFAYGMLIAAAFGVLSGAWPAWRMSRLQAVEALRGGAQ